MACIRVYGQGYQSPGDGGDIESTLDITDEELEEIKAIAKEKDLDLDELEFDDIPGHIMEQMEKALEDEWGYVDGEYWHTFVSGFSIVE